FEDICPIKSAITNPNFVLFSWQGNNVVTYYKNHADNVCK
ncbi:MAG: hypothetical protein RLZZ546_699, partial [Bacteroidota bacterium]